MRRSFVVLAAVAIGLTMGLVVAGCGGGGTTTVTVTGEDTSEQSAAAGEIQERVERELEEEEAGGEAGAEESSGANECVEKEINEGARQEGTCVEEGVKYVVANLHSPVKLETLEARLLGVKERKKISSEFSSATAHGVFVTFPLKITNLTHAPVEFEESQAILLVNDNVYTQDFNVQNGKEEDSFLWREGPIQPQEAAEGTVTFDIPTAVAKEITENGNLDIANFGVEYYAPEEFFELDEIGSIRTYK